MNVPMTVAVSEQSVPMNVSASAVNVPMDLSMAIVIGEDPYTGEYEVTPNESTQILLTQDKFMEHNLVVNPIPSNYGKVSWDGSKILIE